METRMSIRKFVCCIAALGFFASMGAVFAEEPAVPVR